MLHIFNSCYCSGHCSGTVYFAVQGLNLENNQTKKKKKTVGKKKSVKYIAALHVYTSIYIDIHKC